MTKSKKTERVIEWLTESHVWGDGGYPYAHATHAGKLFVATLLGDNETGLDEYDLEELPSWYDRAAAYLKQEGLDPSWRRHIGDDFGDWDEAFNETTSPASDPAGR